MKARLKFKAKCNIWTSAASNNTLKTV